MSKINIPRAVFFGAVGMGILVVGFLILKDRLYRPVGIKLNAADIQKYREWKPPQKGVVLSTKQNTRGKGISLATERYTSGKRQPRVDSKGAIREFIRERAIANKIDPEKALFIAEHESQFNPSAVGDSGISFGIWQFNLRANPHIPKECALDYKCSTEIAMNWLAAGKENAWSVWRMRNYWYNRK